MEAATQSRAKEAMTFRLPQERVEALRGRAKESGQTMTEIVDQALSVALTASEEGSKDGLDAGPHQASPQGHDEINLTSWLQVRTEQPRSLLRMWISQGRVTVGGEVQTDPFVLARDFGHVELDGEPVAP